MKHKSQIILRMLKLGFLFFYYLYFFIREVCGLIHVGLRHGLGVITLQALVKMNAGHD